MKFLPPAIPKCKSFFLFAVLLVTSLFNSGSRALAQGFFEADFSGPGNAMITTGGGTAVGPTPPPNGSNWNVTPSVTSSSCMGQGNYFDLNVAASATSGGYAAATFTPSSGNSFSMFTGSNGTNLLLNGTLQFFFRTALPPSASVTQNWFRPLDTDNRTATDGLRLIVVNSPVNNANLDVQLLGPSGKSTFTQSGTPFNATVSSGTVSLNTTGTPAFSLLSDIPSNLAVQFSSNASTGVITMSVYGVNDPGNLPLNSNYLLAQASFKIAGLTVGLTASSFNFPFCYPTNVVSSYQVSFDCLRIYNTLPPSVKSLATPVILHASESASPGDVISLQGSNFGLSPVVNIHRVTGSETSLTPDPTPLTVINSTTTSINSCVNAQIPTGQTFGLYAVWVKDGPTLSAPVFINQARAWGAVDLAGSQVDPNRVFHLYGRNLYVTGSAPTVSFVNGGTSLPATVTTSGSDAYTLKVTAPSGLTAGTTYTVKVSNGYGDGTGGRYGVNPITLTLTGRAAGTDSFALGLPWGADFSGIAATRIDVTQPPYNADKTGTNDCRVAIQNAMNAANALPNGGIVYFPAGTYWVNTSAPNDDLLTMKSNVVLQGAGASYSTITFSGGNVDTGWNAGIYASVVNKIGFTGLNFNNTATGAADVIRIRAPSSEIFITDSVLQGFIRLIECQGNNQVDFDNCTFTHQATGYDSAGHCGDLLYLNETSNVIVQNSTMFHHIRHALIGATQQALYQNNTITRDTYEDAAYTGGSTPGITRGFAITASEQIAVLNNTFGIQVTNGPSQVVDVNDCETIMDENNTTDDNSSSTCDTGQVTSATANTLTDTTKNWATTGSNTYGQTVPGLLSHYSVAIIGGPGAGQLRMVTANTANTLTVDSNWAVQPNAQSVYDVRLIARHLLIDHNTLKTTGKGIWMYGASEQDDSVVNNTLIDSAGIWFLLDFRPFQNNVSRFDVQFDAQITNNTVSDTLHLYPAFIGTSHGLVEKTNGAYPPSNSPYYNLPANGVFDIGTAAFGMEYRSNSVTGNTSYTTYNEGQWAYGEGYYCFPVSDLGGGWGPGYPIDQADGPAYPPGAPVYSGDAFPYQGVIFQHNTATSISAATDPFQIGTGAYQIGTGDSCTVIYDATYNSLPAGTDEINDLKGQYSRSGSPVGGASNWSAATAVNNSIITKH